MMTRIFVLVVLVAYTCADPISGNCPDIPAALNFNSTAFAGVWFDQAHTRRGTGLRLKCDLVRFTSPSTDKLIFSSFTYSSATKQTIGVSGDVEAHTPAVGKLQVHIPSLKLTGEVRVLSTDYSTFAVLWACNNADGSHSVRVLVLTRDKNPSNSLLTAATKVLENNNISKKDLSDSTQRKCHDYDINADGLSNSLGSSTSMGSLLSVYTTAAPASATTHAPSTSTTHEPSSTTTPASTASSTTSDRTRVADIAHKAQKVWSSITG